MAFSRVGANKESLEGLIDSQEIIKEYGTPITLRIRQENDITRDKYNSIKRRGSGDPALSLYAFPVIFSPTQKDLEKAGIKEQWDVVLYISNKTMIENSLTIDDIDTTRSTIILKDQKYLIKEKNYNSMFQNNYLYITFGLRKQ